jgi:hypothetical protein
MYGSDACWGTTARLNDSSLPAGKRLQQLQQLWFVAPHPLKGCTSRFQSRVCMLDLNGPQR